jgi:cullin 1
MSKNAAITKKVNNCIDDVFDIIFRKKTDVKMTKEKSSRYYSEFYSFSVDSSSVGSNDQILYEFVDTGINRACAETDFSNFRVENTNLCKQFLDQYSNFRIINKFLGKFEFGVLDRYYTARSSVLSVRELIMKCFDTHLLLKKQDVLEENIINQINVFRHNNYEHVDLVVSAQINKICKIYAERHKDLFLKFIDQVLDSSKQYYRVTLGEIAKGGVSNMKMYFENMEKSYSSEDQILNFMAQYKNITEELNKIFLTNNLDIFRESDYIYNVIAETKTSEIATVYNVMSKTPETTQVLAEKFVAVFANDFDLLQGSFGEAKVDEAVAQIIQLHMKFKDKMTNQFNKNNIVSTKYYGFISDQFTKKIKIGEKEYTYSSILADYIHKSYKAKHEFDSHDEKLEAFIELFTCICDKDYFLEIYGIYLAKRLVEEECNFEFEQAILREMKMICGSNYTYGLECMIKDIRFGINYDTSIVKMKLLTYGQWPSFIQVQPTNSTVVIQSALDEYIAKYTAANESRRLTIDYNLSKITLDFAINKHKFILECSLMDANVLMLFNDDEMDITLTGQEIAKELNIDFSYLHPCLKKLQKVKIIKTVDEEGSKIKETTKIKINEKFRTKNGRRVIKLRPMFLTEDMVHKKIDQNIEILRTHALKAAIVRIMKSRRTIDYSELLNEVMKQIKLFIPTVKSIKKTIEELIASEYIERNKTERNQFNYLA